MGRDMFTPHQSSISSSVCGGVMWKTVKFASSFIQAPMDGGSLGVHPVISTNQPLEYESCDPFMSDYPINSRLVQEKSKSQRYPGNVLKPFKGNVSFLQSL